MGRPHLRHAYVLVMASYFGLSLLSSKRISAWLFRRLYVTVCLSVSYSWFLPPMHVSAVMAQDSSSWLQHGEQSVQIDSPDSYL